MCVGRVHGLLHTLLYSSMLLIYGHIVLLVFSSNANSQNEDCMGGGPHKMKTAWGVDLTK